MDELRARIEANTGGPYRRVTGTIVADRLGRTRPGNRQALDRLERSGMYAVDWQTLLAQAERQFRDYFEVMVERTPDDPRVLALKSEEQSETAVVPIEPVEIENEE